MSAFGFELNFDRPVQIITLDYCNDGVKEIKRQYETLFRISSYYSKEALEQLSKDYAYMGGPYIIRSGKEFFTPCKKIKLKESKTLYGCLYSRELADIEKDINEAMEEIVLKMNIKYNKKEIMVLEGSSIGKFYIFNFSEEDIKKNEAWKTAVKYMGRDEGNYDKWNLE